MSVDLCCCCGKELPFEGEQVCYDCKHIAKEEKPVFIRMMIEEKKEERKKLAKRIFEIDYTINELERAERRL